MARETVVSSCSTGAHSISGNGTACVCHAVRELPGKTLLELEQLNRNFLWGGHEPKNKVHPIAWRTVCTGKQEGELGLRTLTAMNTVLLAKLGWQFLHHPDSIWGRLLCQKYGGLSQLQRVSEVVYVPSFGEDRSRFLLTQTRYELDKWPPLVGTLPERQLHDKVSA